MEELLLMMEQMQDELDQKDQTIQELNRQLSESLTLNEKLNSENRAENIEALRTKLKQTEEQLTSETDSRKRADAEVVAWKFKYEKAEQAKRYAQTHQKTVEVPVEKKVPYEKCDNCPKESAPVTNSRNRFMIPLPIVPKKVIQSLRKTGERIAVNSVVAMLYHANRNIRLS